jgi:hypothetical protein
MVAVDFAIIEEAINIFEQASGAQLNPHKSKALATGGWNTTGTMCRIKYFQLITILGVTFWGMTRQSMDDTWARMIGKVHTQAKKAYDGLVNSGDCFFWSQAYRNLKHASRNAALMYNRGHEPQCFHVGDTVRYHLKLVSSKAQDVTAKMMLRWSKPMVIVKEIRPNVVLLAHPDTGVIARRAHVSQLKGCVL